MRCLILGYYGAKNIGDDMMLHALLRWLNTQEREVSVISENPEDTKTRFGVNSIQNTPLLLQWGWVGTVLKGRGWHLFKAIYNTDELLIGGGDLIHDTRGWKNFFYTLEKLILAVLLGKTVYMISVGIGRPTKAYARFLLKYLMPKCKLIVVRDIKSLALCKEFDIENVILAPDIATTIPDYLNIEIKTSVTPYCLVTLRTAPNVYGGYEMDKRHYLAVASALDAFNDSTGYNVVFLPYQSSDNAEHTAVLNLMNNKSSAELLPWNGDLTTMFQLAAGASLVIGMRLHALIAAVTMNTPCIAMPYDTKLHEFCNLAGISSTITSDELLQDKKLDYMIQKVFKTTPAYKYFETANWTNITLEQQ